MTTITADLAAELFRTPPPALAHALEALTAIRAQKGARAAAAWAQAGQDESAKLVAILFETSHSRSI